MENNSADKRLLLRQRLIDRLELLFGESYSDEQGVKFKDYKLQQIATILGYEKKGTTLSRILKDPKLAEEQPPGTRAIMGAINRAEKEIKTRIAGQTNHTTNRKRPGQLLNLIILSITVFACQVFAWLWWESKKELDVLKALPAHHLTVQSPSQFEEIMRAQNGQNQELYSLLVYRENREFQRLSGPYLRQDSINAIRVLQEGTTAIVLRTRKQVREANFLLKDDSNIIDIFQSFYDVSKLFECDPEEFLQSETPTDCATVFDKALWKILPLVFDSSLSYQQIRAQVMPIVESAQAQQHKHILDSTQ